MHVDMPSGHTMTSHTLIATSHGSVARNMGMIAMYATSVRVVPGRTLYAPLQLFGWFLPAHVSINQSMLHL